MISTITIKSSILTPMDNCKGGFGICYRGFLPQISKYELVFKKYIHSKDNKISSDVINEVIILNYLKTNEHVVKMYGIAKAEDTGEIYIILENLDKCIYEVVSNKFSIDKLKNIFHKIIDAYYSIHKMGIFHSDVKVSNIMIKDNKIKLIDFGGSMYLGLGCCNGKIGSTHLSASTLAPENNNTLPYYKKGSRKSYCSDIYSLGVVFCQLILTDNSKFYVKGKKIYGCSIITEKEFTTSQLQSMTNIFISKKIKINDDTFIISYYDFSKSKDYTKKLEKKIGNLGIDLLLKMMDNNTCSRISFENIINHKFFNTFIETNKPIIEYNKITDIENYLTKNIDIIYANDFINLHKNIMLDLNVKISKNIIELLYTHIENYDSCLNTLIIYKSNTTINNNSVLPILSYYNSVFSINREIISNDFSHEIAFCTNIISIYGCIIYLIDSLRLSIPINLDQKLCQTLLELSKINTFYMISILIGHHQLFDIIQYSILISLKIANQMYLETYHTFITTLLSNNLLKNFTINTITYNNFNKLINLDNIFLTNTNTHIL